IHSLPVVARLFLGTESIGTQLTERVTKARLCPCEPSFSEGRAQSGTCAQISGTSFSGPWTLPGSPQKPSTRSGNHLMQDRVSSTRW
ncbi:hypothetical protein M9458_024202, partial [Cirrhinus mrigala]